MKQTVAPISRRARRAARYAAYAALSILVLLGAVHLVARAWLPELVQRKAELEQYLSERAGRSVQIGHLAAYWDGIYPGAHLRDISVADPEGRVGVRLAEAHLTIRLLPLLRGQLEIHRVVLTRPSFTLERRPSGRIRLLGFEVESDRPGRDGRLIDFLLRQGQVVVRDGELTWLDAQGAEAPLRLTGVEIGLRNSGDRHRLELTARFPEAMCRKCRLLADIDGNPLADSDWDGEIRIEASGLDMEALPRILRERLPATFRGRFDVRLWTDWSEGRLRAARGPAAVRELRLPLPDLPHPLVVGEAAGQFRWTRRGEEWQLDGEKVVLGLAGRPWEAGDFRLVHSGTRSMLRVDHLDLGDITSFVTRLEGQQPWLRHWVALRPEGAVDDLDARIYGPLHAPTAFAVTAELKRAGFAAHEKVPGLRGVTGRIEVHKDAGQLELDADELVLDLPRVFRAPLEMRRASGKIVWERTAEHWAIEGAGLRLSGADGEGEGTLELLVPHDRARSPVLRLRADFRNGNGAHAARYYPIHHLPARVLAWMESSFVDGRITSGSLRYEGPIRQFPFEAGEGRFELDGHVTNGVYRFLPGWTPVTQAEADVSIRGSGVRVVGKGRIGRLLAEDVQVEVRGARGSPERAVHVRGRLTGPVAETVRVLRAVQPARPWQAWLPERLRATGDGTLTLAVRVPLQRKRDREAGETRYEMHGEYRVTNATARFGGLSVGEGIGGEVRFDEDGLRGANLTGRLYGGPALFLAETREDRLRIAASGEAQAAELLKVRPALAARVGGWVPWSFVVEEAEDGPRLRLEAGLTKVKSRLPAPLDPSAFTADKLIVRTELSRPNVHLLDVRAQSGVAGKLVFTREEGGWRFASGRIDLGTAAGGLPRAAGLHVNARADALDVDEWLPLLGGEGGGEPPAWLARVTARLERFDLFDRSWGRTTFELRPEAGGWNGTLDGQAASGRVRYMRASPAANGAPARFDLDLLFLRLPGKKHPGRDTAVEPQRLPAITLRAGVLSYGERMLGKAALEAAPFAGGWRVARFSLERPDMQLAGQGVWRGSAVRQTTELSLELESSDMGRTLAAFGAADQMAQGKARVSARLTWPGSPSNPKLNGLDGEVKLEAEKGRFLQIKPGAARLFGLVDLKSIARYFTLDFAPAFGKGLAFDEIRGDLRIERGNAYTQNLILKGPSLALGVNGRIGLATEDYDLLVEVTPKFSDAVTLTSWGLFGPQAAAAALAIQKIFKKQIASTTRVNYVVRGPWDQPTVTRLGKSSPERGENDGGG